MVRIFGFEPGGFLFLPVWSDYLRAKESYVVQFGGRKIIAGAWHDRQGGVGSDSPICP